MKTRSFSLLLSPLTALLYTTSLTNAQTPPACPSTLNNFVLLDESTVFYYALLPSTATGSNDPPNGILCGRVEHEGEAWISLAVAQTANAMVGGEAIIGLPDENSVRKYQMTGKSANLVTPMAELMQTLWDESIVQEDGKTIMTFTKWLVEENELEIAEGRNDFLFASGSSNTLAYHAARTGVSVNLMAEELDVLTTTTSTEMMDETTTATTSEAAVTTDVSTVAAATTDIATTTEAPMMNDPTTEATIATSEAASTEAATTTDAMTTTSTTTTITPDGLDCTVEFCENELTSGYLQRYKVNVPEGQDPENCEGCSISMELIYEGEAWLAIAFTENARMTGSEAVIGIPGSTPLKYNLDGYSLSTVTPMPDEQQTLIDASITVNDNGQTVMTFTKLMNEPDELEIVYGLNRFLWAHGDDATLAYHGSNFGYFTLDVAEPGAAVAETDIPVEDDVKGLDCTAVFCENELDDGFLKRYKINVPEGQDPENGCEGCSVSMELIYEGEAWLSIGFSEDGKMIGSEAVIGVPGGTPQKYIMNGYALNLVELLPEEQQTLTDASITVNEDGQTVMAFTKLMSEPGEIEIVYGDNRFLWAHGNDATLSYHGNNRAAFSLDLAAAGAAVAEEEVTDPTDPPVEAEEDGVNVPDAIQDPSEGQDCTTQFCENELTTGFLQKYRINVPDGQDPETCDGCTIDMELIYDGEAWVSIGFSLNGRMIGSEAVIGIPGSTTLKYNLNGYSDNLVQPMPQEQQTLTDASTVFQNGQTIMKFTKIMKEPGEVEILFGDNDFLWAHGSAPALTYHSARSAFVLNLSSGAAQEVTAPNKGLWLAHGVMLFLAWGVFVPFAVQASLLRKLLPEGGVWFQIHRGLNTVSLALFIAGFAISVATTSKEEQPHFSNPHRRMGLAMFIMAILQMIGGIVRPHNPPEGEKKKPVRVGWEVGHRVLGVSLLACGFWQMYEGILLYGVKYSTDESDEEAITIAYWVWISVMIAVMVLGGAFFKLRK